MACFTFLKLRDIFCVPRVSASRRYKYCSRRNENNTKAIYAFRLFQFKQLMEKNMRQFISVCGTKVYNKRRGLVRRTKQSQEQAARTQKRSQRLNENVLKASAKAVKDLRLNCCVRARRGSTGSGSWSGSRSGSCSWCGKGETPSNIEMKPFTRGK